VRTWLRRALWLAGFGCLWLNVGDDPPLWTGAYLQDVGRDAATVACITAEPALLQLTVRRADDSVLLTAVEGEARRRHALRVQGLAPGAEYTYELEGCGGVERGRIRTASDDERVPVRFAFLGDSGAQPWWVWLQRTPILHFPARWGWFPDAGPVSQIGAAVAAWQPDFVLHLGDVIYPRGQHAHYRPGFFSPFAAALRNAPFYVVVGNHDVMDADGQQVLANFRMPASSLTGDGRCFSFARGPVRIIGLDCNTDRTGDRYGADHPAHRYLLGELQAATEPFVIVASHFPMRSWSRQGNRGELLLGLLPELAAHGVTLYLSGHDHCYQRFGEPGASEPMLVVSGGGGKDLYDLKAAQAGPRPAAMAKAFHWCGVEVGGGRLLVQAYGLDGAVLDRFEAKLPTAELLARIRAQNPARAARIERLGG
jgi:acid phosphatase type 7